jgi:hypothetical protein
MKWHKIEFGELALDSEFKWKKQIWIKIKHKICQVKGKQKFRIFRKKEIVEIQK